MRQTADFDRPDHRQSWMNRSRCSNGHVSLQGIERHIVTRGDCQRCPRFDVSVVYPVWTRMSRGRDICLDMVKVVGEDEQLAWDLKTPPRKRKKRPGPKRDPRKRDPEHRTRPAHAQREPVHVVLRVLDDVPRLRGFEGYRAIRGALARIGMEGFRAVHTSIQQSHLHFIVEADDKRALSRGMQGLAISIAKRINLITKRRGKVFAFRYHATAIRTPTQARRALNYVLRASTRIRRFVREDRLVDAACGKARTQLLRRAYRYAARVHITALGPPMEASCRRERCGGCYLLDIERQLHAS